MKAMLYKKYGGPEVLHPGNVPKPQPKANEVLVKNHYTTVTAGDYRLRKADPFIIRFMGGFNTPKQPILGHEFSGEVVEVGDAVSKFKVGDRVFGSTEFNSAAYAEYICMEEDAGIAQIPEGITDEQAAATPIGAGTALHFLQKAEVKAGEHVLVYGASGSVGSYAVQLAKHMGAQVTAVCSGRNADLMKEIGADVVIDYKTEDYTKGTQRYDVIFDAVGETTYSAGQYVMNEKGRFIACNITKDGMLYMMLAPLIGSKKVIGGVALTNAEMMDQLVPLLKDGAIKPVIDRCYDFEDLPKAHAYADTGRKRGNVTIKVA